MKTKRTAAIITALAVALSVFLTAAPRAEAATLWTEVHGRAVEVGIGAKGDVWVIGTNGDPHKWTGTHWQKIIGINTAKRIDVDINGNAWVVTTTGSIYFWTGSKWNQVPGGALDVGVSGANGAVWVVGSDSKVYRRVSSGWELVPGLGGAKSIDVDVNGRPWVVTATGSFYFWTGSQWNQVPGGGKDIGVTASANGAVWVVGSDSKVYRRVSSGWELAGLNNVTALSVGPDGFPWAVDSAGVIRRAGHAVQVPNVAGMTKTQAEAALQAAGLTSLVAYQNVLKRPDLNDKVSAQSPAAGQNTVRGSHVTVTLYRDMRKVPDLYYFSLDPYLVGVLKRDLDRRGLPTTFNIGGTTIKSGYYGQKKMVYKQSPARYTLVPPGTVMTFWHFVN